MKRVGEREVGESEERQQRRGKHYKREREPADALGVERVGRKGYTVGVMKVVYEQSATEVSLLCHSHG
jgi:hypothetical protein